MHPVKRKWMYNHWVEDQNEKVDLAKNLAYLIGWFHNPEAAKKLMGNDGTTYVSSDEDFEKSSSMMTSANPVPTEKKRKRRNRQLKDN